MKTFSYREALRNTGRNRLAKFPDRESDRLEPVAQPSFAAGLTLAAGDKVLTMGSCFARNIEEYLAGVGYDVPVLGYDGPAAESEQGGRVQGILNKYTVASIWQEVAWVDKVRRGGGTVTMAALEGMAEEVGEDRGVPFLF